MLRWCVCVILFLNKHDVSLVYILYTYMCLYDMYVGISFAGIGMVYALYPRHDTNHVI